MGRGEQVFDFGDEGHNFYIILEGTVDIIVPILTPATAADTSCQSNNERHTILTTKSEDQLK